MCSIPCFLRNDSNWLLQNWVPLSDTSVVGKLLRLKIWYNWLITIAEVVFKWNGFWPPGCHIHVREQELKPPFHFGNGPTMAMYTRSDGTEITSLSCIGHTLGCALVYFWHTSQDLQCLAISEYILGL